MRLERDVQREQRMLVGFVVTKTEYVHVENAEAVTEIIQNYQMCITVVCEHSDY